MVFQYLEALAAIEKTPGMPGPGCWVRLELTECLTLLYDVIDAVRCHERRASPTSIRYNDSASNMEFDKRSEEAHEGGLG